MSTPVEIAITVKDSEQSLTQRHLLYQSEMKLSHEDQILAGLVEGAIKNFHGTPNDVVVKLKMQW